MLPIKPSHNESNYYYVRFYYSWIDFLIRISAVEVTYYLMKFCRPSYHVVNNSHMYPIGWYVLLFHIYIYIYIYIYICIYEHDMAVIIYFKRETLIKYILWNPYLSITWRRKLRHLRNGVVNVSFTLWPLLLKRDNLITSKSTHMRLTHPNRMRILSQSWQHHRVLWNCIWFDVILMLKTKET